MKNFLIKNFILFFIFLLYILFTPISTKAQHCVPTTKTCSQCDDCPTGHRTCTDGCNTTIETCHNVCQCTDGPSTCTPCSSQCGAGTRTCSKCGIQTNSKNAWCTTNCISWTSACNNTCIVNFSGNLFEDYANGVCNAGIGFNPTYSALSIDGDPCVTYPINEVRKTTYSCAVNVSSPNKEVSIFADHPIIYSNVYWKDSCGSTPTAKIRINIPTDSLTQNISKDLYFVTENLDWFKISNSTYFSHNTYSRGWNPPETILPYDSDDNTNKHIVINDAGLVISENDIQTLTSAQVSNNNYRLYFYPINQRITSASSYYEYVIANKKFREISGDPTGWNISGDTSISIFVYKTNLTINDSVLSAINVSKPIVLFVNGNINFDLSTNTFSPSNSIALFANKISFFKQDANPESEKLITEAKGIFIANEMAAGRSTNKGLKIIGNINLLGNLINFSNRRNNTPQKPSLFVKFDSKISIDLLPFASTSIYEWKEM